MPSASQLRHTESIEKKSPEFVYYTWIVEWHIDPVHNLEWRFLWLSHN